MDADDHELRVAQLIQQQFLPRRLPTLLGWTFAAHYQPAREVGGDFYDVTALPGGLIGLAVGDVAGKGIPAALLMATTHSVLRAEAHRLISPGAVLARVNAQLVHEMPPGMFVTCFYLVLDPLNGRLRYANAGHCLPYQRTHTGVVELRARGMPLGLMSGMVYEEHDTRLAPGDTLLLHSDGLAEAHNEDGEMFGFPRLQRLVAHHQAGEPLIASLLAELDQFISCEHDDDITLLTLTRATTPVASQEQVVGHRARRESGTVRQAAEHH
jgi:serine phosphatase RsbU (regulator of sigma subunit)